MIAISELVGGNVLAQVLLDAIPSPVFLLDDRVRIVGFNAAARQVLENAQGGVEPTPDAPLDCIHGVHQSICGQKEACNYCLVRNLVLASFAGHNTVRHRATVRLGLSSGIREFDIHLSTTRFEHEGVQRVMLMIEEPLDSCKKPLGLVPICARCKKIRDEEDRWRSPERFLADRWGIRLTHGLCPDCLTTSLAEVGTERDEAV